MNSIIETHFGAPSGGASSLEAALDRMGAWLDAERDTLGRVLAQGGRPHAAAALEALDQLHLEPRAGEAALHELLEDALGALEYLLATLRAIPSRCALETAWGLPGPASFDTHLRWSGARLQDIVATLRRALDA
jgi:hypothetical protein